MPLPIRRHASEPLSTATLPSQIAGLHVSTAPKQRRQLSSSLTISLNGTPRHHHRSGNTTPSPLIPIVEEEYDCGYLNLGAESPLYSGASSPSFFGDVHQIDHGAPSNGATGQRLAKEWAVTVTGSTDGIAPQLSPKYKPGPSARRNSMSSATGQQRSSRRKEVADRDCGICFEYAVKPARTLCCGTLFCKEHLRDWLHGPNASGLCPNCDAPCKLDQNTLSLISPPLRPRPDTTAIANGPPRATMHFERLEHKHLPASPLATAIPITHHRRSSAEDPVPSDTGLEGGMKRRSTSPPNLFSVVSQQPSRFAASQAAAVPGAESGPDSSFNPPPYSMQPLPHMSLDVGNVSPPKDRARMAAQWALPSVNVQPKSEFGTSTPGSMWASASMVWQRGKPRPGALDSFKTRSDAFSSIVHLATLVMVMMLIYVVVGGR